MDTHQSKHHALRTAMLNAVERYYQSGLSRQEFCRREGLSVTKLSYWVTQYRRHQQQEQSREEPARFVALLPEAEAANEPRASLLVELCLENGMRLRIYRG